MNSVRKIIEIYEKIERDADYDLEAFLSDNNMEIETAEFISEEKDLLKKYCIQRFLGVPEDLECSICLNPFQVSEEIMIYPTCHHHYHQECLNLWLDTKVTCPLCRANLRISLMREIKKQVHPQELIRMSLNEENKNQELSQPLI